MSCRQIGWKALAGAVALLALAGPAAAEYDTIYVDAEVETPAGIVDAPIVEQTLPETHPSDFVDAFINNNEQSSEIVTFKPEGDDATLTLPLLPDGSLTVPFAGNLWNEDPVSGTTYAFTHEAVLPVPGTVRVAMKNDPSVDSRDYTAENGAIAHLGVGVQSETFIGDGSNSPSLRHSDEEAPLAAEDDSPAPSTPFFSRGGDSSAAGFTVPASPPPSSPGLPDGYFRVTGDSGTGVFHPAPVTDPAQKPATLVSQGETSVGATPDLLKGNVEVLAGAAALGLLLMAPWLLYHRLKGHRTLENGPRKAIYDAIVATPGLGVQEVADRAAISYSTASYHLDRLLKARMIVVSDAGGKLRYYKNGGAVNETERALIPLVQNQEAMRVLEGVLAKPGTYRAELAAALNVSVTAVNWHLKRLLDAGLITEAREGRSARLFVNADALRAAMAPLLEKIGGATEATLVRRIVAGETLDAAAA